MMRRELLEGLGMGLRMGTVCSGIGAPELAGLSVGMEGVWCSEVARLPCAVLEQRFPGCVNLGDMTKIEKEAVRGTVDVVVGGTPCQSFSVAGLRGGLADPRGNLALEFLRLVVASGAGWFVWENVPGVLSSNGGRDFGALLGAMGQLGYGWAYRVLDAQFCGVHQRRRRVIVVGCAGGGWQRAAAVLFEWEGVCGDFASGGAAREGVAYTLEASVGGVSGKEGRGLAPVGEVDEVAGFDLAQVTSAANCTRVVPGAALGTLAAGSRAGVAHTLRGVGFDASEDGTGRGSPLVVGGGSDVTVSEMMPALTCRRGDRTAVVGTLSAGAHPGGFNGQDVMNLVVGMGAGGGDNQTPLVAGAGFCLRSNGSHSGDKGDGGVRRLMPVEWERLQGFPDGWTDVLVGGKRASDSARYAAIGNSMAVPVMRWVLGRVALVDAVGRW